MTNEGKIQEYFQREFADFALAWTNPRKLNDFVRRWVGVPFSKKAIIGRLDALVELVGDNIHNKRILEVGCGPGIYSIRLAKKGAQVTGIDYSPGMINEAKRIAQEAGVEVDFKVGDFFTENLEGLFNCVFATGVMDYIDLLKRQAFLEKMKKLSVGPVIVSFPKKYVLHAFVRSIWLRLFKGIRISFFTDKDIASLASLCGLREIDRRDVEILWVIKFEETE